MRLLICAGGTGGGVYPALAVLQTLGDKVNSVLWVGAEGGMEAEMVTRLNIPFSTIPAAGVHGVGLRALPGNILRLIRGVIASRKILADFKPDALLFTGGYVAVPMAVAGIKTPSLLYVPDIEPGLAIKAIARFSDCLALTALESKSYFKFHHRLVVTGYPLRKDLLSHDRDTARHHFKLHNKKPVVLIFGGSKGAQSINRATYAMLPFLLEKSQILHITGSSNLDDALSNKKNLSANSDDYHPIAFLHDDMGAAFASADLAICRAGASTLGELPAFGLPAILVPYPYAWRYQKTNANYLVKNGAAFLLQDEMMTDNLLPLSLDLLNSPEKLTEMSQRMKKLAKPEAAQNIAAELFKLAGEHD